MRMNRMLSSLIVASLALLASCGGGSGGSSEGNTGDPSMLYTATLTQGGENIGAVVGDDAGNTLVSIMNSADGNAVSTLLGSFADGSEITATVEDGRPVSVTDGTTTATFSNWDGTTVDVTITSDGESETITGVDYSEYAAQSLTTKGWPQFFGATWTTITVAFCPVSIGAGLPAAIVGCTLAGTNLYRLLNGQSTLVEEVATALSAPASCATVAENGGTAAERQQCMSETLTTLPSTPAYIDENGELVTDDDGDDGSGSSFAGSCTAEGNICTNYVGSNMTAAEARSACQQMGGSYSSSVCSTVGIVGTCTMGAGTVNEYEVTFYDDLYTTDIARQTCSAMSGTFTAR